jgi:hypothetical protein
MQQFNFVTTLLHRSVLFLKGVMDIKKTFLLIIGYKECCKCGKMISPLQRSFIYNDISVTCKSCMDKIYESFKKKIKTVKFGKGVQIK